MLDRRFQATWIWKAAIYPKIRLLWKAAWDRLSTPVLLKNRGMEIPVAYPVCELEDESIEHSLLRYPTTRLIWRMASDRPWRANTGPWPISFLDMIRRSSAEGPIGTREGRMAYVAYQIWQSRNSLMFEAEIVLAY